MKMINTANPSLYSKDLYERFAAFFLDCDSFKAMHNRYKTFLKMAKILRNGDTFIADTIPNTHASNLACYVDVLNHYNCNFIKTLVHGGEFIRDERGMIIAKSSCNVYQFNANPEVIFDILSDVRECFMRRFEE